MREHIVKVRVDGAELAELDAAAARAGLTRSRFLRQVIAQGAEEDVLPVPTHREAIALLAQRARSGNVAATVALERALRTAEQAVAPVTGAVGPISLDEWRQLRTR